MANVELKPSPTGELMINAKLIENLVQAVCNVNVKGNWYATRTGVADALVTLLKSVGEDVRAIKTQAKSDIERANLMISDTREMLAFMSTEEYPVASPREAMQKYQQMREYIHESKIRNVTLEDELDFQKKLVMKLTDITAPRRAETPDLGVATAQAAPEKKPRKKRELRAQVAS